MSTKNTPRNQENVMCIRRSHHFSLTSWFWASPWLTSLFVKLNNRVSSSILRSSLQRTINRLLIRRFRALSRMTCLILTEQHKRKSNPLQMHITPISNLVLLSAKIKSVVCFLFQLCNAMLQSSSAFARFQVRWSQRLYVCGWPHEQYWGKLRFRV